MEKYFKTRFKWVDEEIWDKSWNLSFSTLTTRQTMNSKLNDKNLFLLFMVFLISFEDSLSWQQNHKKHVEAEHLFNFTEDDIIVAEISPLEKQEEGNKIQGENN